MLPYFNGSFVPFASTLLLAHYYLLFNVYINDLFLMESTNVCNYVDDTTFHAGDIDLEKPW